MASPGSFIRSAAQGTSSAYRRLPIRWRLAGGSALLTLVILLGFATIVGVLTTRQIDSEFDRQVADAATDLQSRVRPRIVVEDETFTPLRLHAAEKESPDLDTYADDPGRGDPARHEATARCSRRPRTRPSCRRRARRRQDFNGFRVESRPVELRGGFFHVQYARKLSDVRETANSVRVFLGLGVIGGAALALLAGVATATRAMAPISRLTEAASAIARTRDPVAADPASGVERRGLGARAHAREHAAIARRRARRDRGDARAPAPVRR